MSWTPGIVLRSDGKPLMDLGPSRTTTMMLTKTNWAAIKNIEPTMAEAERNEQGSRQQASQEFRATATKFLGKHEAPTR